MATPPLIADIMFVIPRASTTAVAAACLVLLSSARADDVITLTSGEWLPYLSETLPHHGAISRIVSAAFALEGVTVKYVFRPWSRAYAEAGGVSANGSIVWSSSPRDTDRQRRFYFSDVVFDGQSLFFHLKSYAFQWRGYEKLAGIRIGGTAGYEYSLEKYTKLKMDLGAPTDELNVRKLLAGRFDLFPVNLDVGRHIMRHALTAEQADRLTWDPTPYNITHYHLILNKVNPANPRYLALFNRGLQRLKEGGKYAQYMEELRAELRGGEGGQ